MATATQPGGSTAGVTPQQIYNALVQAGASPQQAAGLMGNAMAESTLNPESAGLDSNGKWSYGLWQWNTGTYPQAGSLVTGNPLQDLQSQITYLAQTGGFAAATGTDPGSIAANFAHTWEQCAACGYQDGSGELSVRSANAQAIWQAVQSGNWSGIRSGGGNGGVPGVAGAPGSPGGSSFDPTAPVIQIPLPVLGNVTILNAGQARTIKAFALIGAGALVMVGGIAVVLAAGFGKATPAARIAGSVLRAPTGRTRASPPTPAPPPEPEVEESVRRISPDEDDVRYEQTRGSRAANRAAYRRQETSDLRKRTA